MTINWYDVISEIFALVCGVGGFLVVWELWPEEAK